jgi:hypothetical protein
LVRITIKDARQTISFLAEKATLLRLIAGCSINPADLSDLLIASDIYQRGLVAGLMADLMTFDKTLARQGPDFIHQAISQTEKNGQPLKMAFQVIDEITQNEAWQAHNCQLAIIDLTARVIHKSQDLEILPAGEVHIQIDGAETNRLVRYILPQEWVIENL